MDLMTDFYELDNEDLNEETIAPLVKRYKELNIEQNEVLVPEHTKTFLYICPDTEGEFPEVFELPSHEDHNQNRVYMDTIANAVLFCNKYDSFLEWVMEMRYMECVLLICGLEEIPIVRSWKSADTEMLNVRWLNSKL